MIRHPVTGQPFSDKSRTVARPVAVAWTVRHRRDQAVPGAIPAWASLLVGWVTCGLGAVIWGVIDALLIFPTDKGRRPLGSSARDGSWRASASLRRGRFGRAVGQRLHRTCRPAQLEFISTAPIQVAYPGWNCAMRNSVDHVCYGEGWRPASATMSFCLSASQCWRLGPAAPPPRRQLPIPVMIVAVAVIAWTVRSLPGFPLMPTIGG